jgi:hypothetical protein
LALNPSRRETTATTTTNKPIDAARTHRSGTTDILATQAIGWAAIEIISMLTTFANTRAGIGLETVGG